MKQRTIAAAAGLSLVTLALVGSTGAAQTEALAGSIAGSLSVPTTATAAAPAAPAAAGKDDHEDTRFGFKFRVPKRFEKQSLRANQPWRPAIYISEVAYNFYDKDRGATATHNPTIAVMVIPKGRLRITDEDEEKKKKEDILTAEKTARIAVPFDDYREYLKLSSQEGFSMVEEEKDTVKFKDIGEVEVIKQTFRTEKLAFGPKTMEAWTYVTPDMDYVVEVVGFTSEWKKISKKVKRIRSTFELIRREGDDAGGAVETGGDSEGNKRKRKRGPRKKLGDEVLVMKDGRIFTDLDAEKKDGKIIIHLESGDVEVADKLVDLLIDPDAGLSFEPQNDEERKNFEDGYVRYKGEWLRKGTAERLVEREIKEQLKNAKEDLAHQTWNNAYLEETKHFNWKFTTPMRVTRRYIDAADQYFEIFKKEWRIKRDRKKEKMFINFYNDARQYQDTAGAPPGALAYFLNIGNYDLNAYYDRLDPDYTEAVVFHELGHYLHKLINEQFMYPHWPGESVCEYYGGARLEEDGSLTVGLMQNGRLGSILSDIERGEKIELRTMIMTRGFEDYSWGWALVHMLMQDSKEAKKFKDFFHGLAHDRSIDRIMTGRTDNARTIGGEEVLRYFMECMDLDDDEDLLAMQDRWYKYITETLEFTGEGAIFMEAKSKRSLGEWDEARKLYKKGFETEMDAAKANVHYDYFLLMSLGDQRSAEAQKHLEMAVEKAPLTAIYRWELGDLLEEKKSKKDKEEGARQKEIALELDPDVEDRIFRFVITIR